jgi:hypothetical protein
MIQSMRLPRVCHRVPHGKALAQRRPAAGRTKESLGRAEALPPLPRRLPPLHTQTHVPYDPAVRQTPLPAPGAAEEARPTEGRREVRLLVGKRARAIVGLHRSPWPERRHGRRFFPLGCRPWRGGGCGLGRLPPAHGHPRGVVATSAHLAAYRPTGASGTRSGARCISNGLVLPAVAGRQRQQAPSQVQRQDGPSRRHAFGNRQHRANASRLRPANSGGQGPGLPALPPSIKEKRLADARGRG